MSHSIELSTTKHARNKNPVLDPEVQVEQTAEVLIDLLSLSSG